MEQVLYKLPEGWDYTDLASLCKFENGDRGKNYPSRDAFVASGIPVINAGNLDGRKIIEAGLNYIPRERYDILGSGKVRQGDLLFCLRGSLGKCAIVSNLSEGAIASSLVIVRPSEALDPNYLLYYFNSPLCSTFIERYNNGAAQPNLSAKSLSKFLIPLTSQKEQKRIVEKLDALLTRIDTAIEHLQESVTLADALSQNGLDVYFAELTETNPELTLSKLADFISGYAFKSGDFTSESGIKPIKITNVGVNEFSENAEEFLPASYETEYQRFAAKTNDIVIALTRPIINGGLKVCRVPEAYSGALVNQRVAAITSHNKHVLDFIYLYLQSSRTRNYVLEKSKSLNQPNLSITDLKNLAIPFPNNDEAIVKAVSDCNALISKARKSKAEISEKITMMQQLKASILDSAFKGEL